MTSTVALQESPTAREELLATPLDEAVWDAWVTKKRAEEVRGREGRIKAAKWISIVALLAAGGLWAYVTPYEVAIRFLAAGGASIVMVQAFQARRYAFAALFGALVLLYNPVVPVFSLSGDWQRVVVIASTVPFFASLTWRQARQ
jgi:hypothetical protein